MTGAVEIFIFGRFHAREACEREVAAALLEVAAPAEARAP
jgi:hypothetical protein